MKSVSLCLVPRGPNASLQVPFAGHGAFGQFLMSVDQSRLFNYEGGWRHELLTDNV